MYKMLRLLLLLLLLLLSAKAVRAFVTSVDSCDEVFSTRSPIKHDTLVLYHNDGAFSKDHKRNNVNPFAAEFAFLKHWINVHAQDIPALKVKTVVLTLKNEPYPSSTFACCNVNDTLQEQLKGCSNEPIMILYDTSNVPQTILQIGQTPVRHQKHLWSYFFNKHSLHHMHRRIRLDGSDPDLQSPLSVHSFSHKHHEKVIVAVLPPFSEQDLFEFIAFMEENHDLPVIWKFTWRKYDLEHTGPILAMLGDISSNFGKPTVPLYYIISFKGEEGKRTVQKIDSIPILRRTLKQHGDPLFLA